MKKKALKDLIELDVSISIWRHFFTISPLVVIGTKEKSGYNLAPKHMVMPIGFENYFGFVCTPKHSTYANIKLTKEFTVSYLLPRQVVLASLSATPRCEEISKSKSIIAVLPTLKATKVDALHIAESYALLECKLYKIIDGFGENSIIVGKIIAARVYENYIKSFDKDEQIQIKENPLLAYISEGRFTAVTETYNFPLPKNFKK